MGKFGLASSQPNYSELQGGREDPSLVSARGWVGGSLRIEEDYQFLVNEISRIWVTDDVFRCY